MIYFPLIFVSYGLDSGSTSDRMFAGSGGGEVESLGSEFRPQTLLGDIACVTNTTVPIRHFSLLERLHFNLKHPLLSLRGQLGPVKRQNQDSLPGMAQGKARAPAPVRPSPRVELSFDLSGG